MNLDNLSNSDIQKAIDTMLENIKYAQTKEQREPIETALKRANDELTRRAQKKSNLEQPQPQQESEAQRKEREQKEYFESLDKEKPDAWKQVKYEEEMVRNQHCDHENERQQPRTVNEVANILEYGARFPAPTPHEPIFTLTERKQVKGEKSVAIKVTRTLSDLRQKMRQNFTNVYTSAEFQERKGDLMKMIAFCNLIVQHAMLNEYYEATGGVTMGDLLSGYRYKSAEQKQRAHMLLIGVLTCQKALIEDAKTPPEKLSQIAKDAIWG